MYFFFKFFNIVFFNKLFCIFFNIFFLINFIYWFIKGIDNVIFGRIKFKNFFFLEIGN